jgi:hypothetical protein
VSARVVAFALLLIAAGLAGGVALPLRARASALQEEARRARQQSEQLRAQLADRQRRLGALAAVEGTNDPGSLRRSVIASLQGAPLSQVRIDVQPAKQPVAASLKLSAEGGFAEVVALSGRLARPGTGIVLARFSMSPRPAGVRVDVTGNGLGARP